RRSFLATEVGLESVSHCFVQKNARPAGTKDDFHLSCRRVDRLQLNDRLPCGFGAHRLRRKEVLKEIEPDASAAAGPSDLAIAVVIGDEDHRDPGHGLNITGKTAFGGRDHDVLNLVVYRRLNLTDATVIARAMRSPLVMRSIFLPSSRPDT